MNDDETTDTQPSDPEPTREDGVLTPAQIIEKHKGRRSGVSSRNGLRMRVRSDLAAYHDARGWGAPDDEKVDEMVREILE